MHYLTIIVSMMLLIVLYLFVINYNHQSNIENYVMLATDQYTDQYTDFPFWNTQIGSTRNMSYDLRGDVQIPYFMQMPFNMTSIMPIQNTSLHEIS